MATKLQILNRGLQRVGVQRLQSLTDTGVNAAESLALYDSVRLAELRRNCWRFAIRRNALYAVSINTLLLMFATWVSGTTYAVGDLAVGSDGQIYQSVVAGNIGNDPTGLIPQWQLYFGPDVAQEVVTTWSSSVTYSKGMHAVGSDSNVYVSLVNSNLNHNPVSTVGTDWQIATTENASDNTQPTSNAWYVGDIVYLGNTAYLSLMSNNTDVPPSANWLTFTAQPTLGALTILYPVGAGPVEQEATLNLVRLPVGYLREAPQDPLVPARRRPWRIESNYIVTNDFAPIVYRYVANVQDATQFDPMFVEGLSCRIALELAERLTQDGAKVAAMANEYKLFMGEARTVNAIEIGPVTPEEDDWITVKVSGAYSPFEFN